MKNLKIISLAALLALFSNSAFAEAKKYNIEPNHATVTWHANHLGFSNPSGKFTDIQGAIMFDAKNPSKSSVDVTIRIASLSTGLPKFDKHLKSADFFNLDEFDTAKFVSNKITVIGKNKAKIAGELTLMGITKPVVLNTTFNKVGPNPFNQVETIGFSATTTIKRSEFNMNYGIPNVSDNVNIAIEIEGII
jgi:polyisoprenoid-binding protein YceI